MGDGFESAKMPHPENERADTGSPTGQSKDLLKRFLRDFEVGNSRGGSA